MRTTDCEQAESDCSNGLPQDRSLSRLAARNAFVIDDDSDSDAYGMPNSRRLESIEPTVDPNMKRWTQHGAPRRSQMMGNPQIIPYDNTGDLADYSLTVDPVSAIN